MRTLKKALSVFLCFVMLFTTFCFFPLTGVSVEAAAANITNEGKRTAFYAPEVIYLYPNVASWTEDTSTYFQYYVENTVDVNNIYDAPVPATATKNKGSLYFASEESIKNVSLNCYFMKENDIYYEAGNGEINVSEPKYENGYYSFEITSGKSPVLSASEDGCYIIWVLEYETDEGEHKGAYAITYVYKPYVVPYGAVARAYSTQGSVNVDNENITWVTGVHSIDSSVSQTNVLFPRYQTVTESASSSLAFSPFLSKDRYGYIGGNKFQGHAPAEKGGYFAVFTNENSPDKAYFWAGQNGAAIDNNRSDSWFIKGQLSSGDKAYTVGAFDYSNNDNETFKNTQHSTAQITPTRLGTINIDTSRYSNLNQIPNLAVGFMITKNTAIEGGNTVAEASGYWVIGDATGKNHADTGAYITSSDQTYALFAEHTGIDTNAEFAREEVSDYPIANGIKYAGAWNKELTAEATEKYTVKSIVKIDDAAFKYNVTSSAVGLNAVQIDKAALREVVMKASQHLGVLGTKRNGMSLYYAATSEEWNSFADNYIAAYKVLTRLDATADQVSKAEAALTEALDTLLGGTALKVLFDVNYGGINPNLLAVADNYERDNLTVRFSRITESYTVDGSATGTTEGILKFDTSFDEGNYISTIENTGGTYTIVPDKSALVFEFYNKDGTTYGENQRLKQDIGAIFNPSCVNFSIDSFYADNNRTFNFWLWKDGNATDNLTFSNLSFRMKLEKAGEATAYSPAAKIIEGTIYGELPVPTRDGYSFGGWYADKACTIPVTEEDPVTARILYADWIPNTYSVTFDNMFSMDEFAKYPTSLTTNRENSTAEYADGKLTVSAEGADNHDVYTKYGCGEDYYNIDLQPSMEYVFEYDVELESGSQVHLFLYDTDNNNQALVPTNRNYAVYDVDGNVLSQGVYEEGKNAFVHCSTVQSGHVVIRFKTPDAADKLAVRFGTFNETTTRAVYSNIRLIDAKTYDLIKWDSAEKFYSYGTTYGELAAATRDGYVFEGWYTAKNGGGNKITEADSVIAGNITLYSNWTANTYNVTLLPNNADSGITIRIEDRVYDTEFALPDVSLDEYNYNKVGHTFIGWSTDPEATVAEFADKSSVKNLTPDANGEATLYAVWSPNVFNVEFDANGGQGTMENVKVAYDSNVPLPECTFTRPGYTFVGWARTNQGSAITEAQYDVLLKNAGETTKLFALWAENVYTVTFDGNGEDVEGTSVSYRYNYTTEFTLPGAIFTKTGYILSGWSTDSNGEKVYDIGQSVSKLTAGAEVTLYAVWTPIKYTVIFNGNGGDGTMDPIPATYGKNIIIPDSTFNKTGYNFIGWATTPGGEAKYFAGDEVKNLASIQGSEVILWAVWEIKTYTVTLNYKNADGEDVSSEVSVKHGESVTIPSDFTEYPMAGNKQHRVFDSWSVSLNNITSDITATASYSIPVSCTTTTSETAATCTKEGSRVEKCRLCAYKKDEVLPMADHSYGEGVITTPVTCLEGGEKTFTCSVCKGTKTETIEAPGHNLTLVEAKTATCKDPGNIEHLYCDRCQKGYDPATATATTPYDDAINYVVTEDHTPGDEATCTTAQICTVCGTELNPALGHSFKVEYLADTYVDCSTTKGDYEIKKTCTVCGHVDRERVYDSFLPHDYVVTTVAPTCTEPGYDLHDCSRCTESYRDNEIAPLGHKDENQKWVKIKDPTCTEPGENAKYCTVCGEISQTQEIPATGHADESECEWSIKDSTCTQTGTKSLICPDCNGVVRTETIGLKAHDFKWTVTIEPGCDTPGKETNKCTVCGAASGSRDLPMLGHDPDGEATCDKDSVCNRCKEVVKEKLGHDWNNGSIIKEPTETEEGLREYICLNDPTHKDYEVIPVRIVIQLPVIPGDGTYDLDANENGYLGNIHEIVTVEDGIEYSVMVDNENILTINEAGYMMAVKDGNAVITIITNDGKYQKQLPVTVRTLKTITFDVNDEKTKIKAYAGNSFTPITVNPYVDENGYEARFKQWLMDGTVLKEFICTGDMYLVAQFTASCDYDKLDELTSIFNDLISGDYNNALLININKQEVNTAKAMIEEFSLERNLRDSEEQGRVDAAAKHIAVTIAKIYPEEGAWIEIRGKSECTAGTYADITAYLMPVGVELADGVWETSDTTTGFFTNGKFYAVKTGVVTLTVSRGSLSASIEITINSTTGARVVFFDTLLTSANYILESGYVIRETTSLFWAPDAAINFRVITDGTFEEYNVYVNDKKVTPDIRGTYTIPANTGDAHVRIEGLMSDITDDSDDSTPTMSFWDAIRNFFKRIADFFRNLFNR